MLKSIVTSSTEVFDEFWCVRTLVVPEFSRYWLYSRTILVLISASDGYVLRNDLARDGIDASFLDFL